MKPLLSLLFFVSLAASPAQAIGITGTLYAKSCRVEYPLYTFDECAPWTDTGQNAADCAESKAEIACRDAFNTDCVHDAPTFREVMSTDPVGYKACEATATVRGYRPN